MFNKLFINNKVSIFFVALLLINLLVGAFVLAKINISLDQKIVDITEGQRSADLDITIIKDPTCQECFDIDLVVDAIKKYNVNIVSEEVLDYGGILGQELITEYTIKTIPSLIIKGELEKEFEVKKILSQLGIINDGVFISTKLNPPYISLVTKKLVGKTNLVMLSDKSCLECYNVQSHKAIMKKLGLYIANEELVDINSSRGVDLVNRYNITLVPTIILTGDVDVYPGLKNIWTQVGSVEQDGAMVFKQGVKSMGIYKDLSNGKIIGSKVIK